MIIDMSEEEKLKLRFAEHNILQIMEICKMSMMLHGEKSVPFLKSFEEKLNDELERRREFGAGMHYMMGVLLLDGFGVDVSEDVSQEEVYEMLDKVRPEGGKK